MHSEPRRGKSTQNAAQRRKTAQETHQQRCITLLHVLTRYGTKQRNKKNGVKTTYNGLKPMQQRRKKKRRKNKAKTHANRSKTTLKRWKTSPRMTQKSMQTVTFTTQKRWKKTISQNDAAVRPKTVYEQRRGRCATLTYGRSCGSTQGSPRRVLPTLLEAPVPGSSGRRARRTRKAPRSP